jgi:hypothetical protein
MRVSRHKGLAAAAIAAVVAGLSFATAALGAFGASIDAGALTVETATLDAPSGLVAVADCKLGKKPHDRVALSWNASVTPAVQGYEIDRSDDGGFTYSKLKRVPSTNLSPNDASVTGPGTYYYEVWAYNHKWTSTPLGAVSVYVPDPTTCT